MGGPIYVPVLPVKRAACNAYARSDPRIRRRIAPLWTFTPRTGAERPRCVRPTAHRHTDPAALNHWFTRCVDGLITAMEGQTGWVDTAHVEPHVEASAEGL